MKIPSAAISEIGFFREQERHLLNKLDEEWSFLGSELRSDGLKAAEAMRRGAHKIRRDYFDSVFGTAPRESNEDRR
jgi:hypothetical protein